MDSSAKVRIGGCIPQLLTDSRTPDPTEDTNLLQSTAYCMALITQLEEGRDRFTTSSGRGFKFHFGRSIRASSTHWKTSRNYHPRSTGGWITQILNISTVPLSKVAVLRLALLIHRMPVCASYWKVISSYAHGRKSFADFAWISSQMITS